MGRTILEILKWAGSALNGTVTNSPSEAEIIVGHVVGETRTGLFAHGHRLVTDTEFERIAELVGRRRASEPLQYLVGSQPFRSLDISVGPGVLVPRPETEIVVEEALNKISGIEAPLVIEIGAGSGAISLSIAKEMPAATVMATELDVAALSWAEENAKRLALPNFHLLEGDLFAPIDKGYLGSVDLVVSNPPYLAESEFENLPADVRDHEPSQATVAGATGLEVSSRIVEESRQWLRAGAWLVLETWEGQWPSLRKLMEQKYLEVDCLPDLTGSLRVAVGRKP